MPASRRSARIRVIAAGVLVCGIGLTVQAGWLLERAALVQIRSDYPAMTFNTAAGFVLLGVGLFLMALGRLRLAATAAGVAAVLGGLTLLEYLSGVNLGIDERIVRDFSQVKTAFPGRMAPTTAVGIVASGAALLALARGREDGAGAKAWPSAGVYLAFFLAAIGFVRYAGGIEQFFAWPVLDSMAPHTAVGFLLVGGGIAAELAWRGQLWLPWRPEQHGRRILVAASALMTLGILVVGSLALQSVAAQATRFRSEQLVAAARSRAHMVARVVEEIRVMTRAGGRDPRMLGVLARRAGGAALSRADIEILEETLSGVVASNADILDAALLDDTGSFVLASSGGTPWPAVAPEDLAWSYRASEPTLGVPRWEADELRVDSIAPLLQNGRRLGFLRLRLALTDVAAIVMDAGGLGESGEVMLGRRAGDRLEFLLPPRVGRPLPEPVGWAAEWAVPMRRALAGESAVIEALDYRGVRVAAAFLPVPGTDWGLVVKSEVAELLTPFRRAARALVVGTLVVVAFGALGLWLVVGPVVRRLANREQFVRSIVQTVPIGLFTARGSRLTYVNPYLCELIGLPPESLLGRAWENALGVNETSDFVPEVARQITSETPFTREFQFVAPSGQRHWMHVGGVPFHGGVGQGRQLQGFCLDITRRKQAEQAFDREHETAAAISRATLRYLETEDLEEMVQSILERCTELTGAAFGWIATIGPGDEIRFIGTTDLVWEGEKGSALIATIRAEIERSGFYGIPAAEGGLLRAAVSPQGITSNDVRSDFCSQGTPESYPAIESFLGVPLRAGEEIVGFIGLANRPGGFRDEDRTEIEYFAPMAALAVTRAQAQQERQALYKRLIRAQKMEAVGRLAGGVAHDFNNFLTVISVETELLLADRSMGRVQHGHVETISQAGQRAAILTRQLLAFGRRQVLRRSVLDLNAVVTDMSDMLRRLIGEHIDLHVSLSPEPLPVNVDQGQIEQVIANLVINARDAMPNGGNLVLETMPGKLGEQLVWRHRTVRADRYVVLRISDAGIGMTEEVKEHLFEPFFTTKGERGTGLGLATAAGIVEQHEGNISFESEEGRGTVFNIYFPAVESKVEVSHVPRASDVAPHGSETILVVEDDDRVRAAACLVLDRLGYTVLSADRPQKALEIAAVQGDSIALLFTDVVMPEMSGIDLASQLRDALPRLRVLYTSGHIDDVILPQRTGEDDFAFLEKPYGLTTLGQRVRQELDRPAP